MAHKKSRSKQTPHAVRLVDVTIDEGQRVDNFLLRQLSGVPKSRVYRMLRKGEVRINGRRVKPEYRLELGDRVRIPPWHGESRESGQPIPGFLHMLARSVIFEDDRLIVIDKPSGAAVHGGSGIALGVIEGLRALYPDDERLELAHRIDRDTSGLLVVARGRASLVALHAAFREGRVGKTYDLLVHGRWPRRVRRVEAPLTRYVSASGERRVRVDLADGRIARTDFEVVEASDAASWLRAFPHTGRTHQIRVHCRSASHPIVGDEKYATKAQLTSAQQSDVRRLCLHASSLRVKLGDDELRFEAQIPADFSAAWQQLISVRATPGVDDAHALIAEERDEADER